jgi:DNA-binding XRE family transcriptional regulator
MKFLTINPHYFGVENMIRLILMRFMTKESKRFLPPGVERSLTTFGRNVSIARRKRGLKAASMATRIGIAENTYAKIERGSPSVNLGAYAMALHVLGFGSAFAELLDMSKDDQGLLLDLKKLPQRVRVPKKDLQP